MRIKKGDTVQVLSGNDKGKTGEVLEVIPKTGKVVVKGANVRKKHVKPRKQGEEGGILSVECGMPISKVNVVCPKCGKTTKVGYKECHTFFLLGNGSDTFVGSTPPYVNNFNGTVFADEEYPDELQSGGRRPVRADQKGSAHRDS